MLALMFAPFQCVCIEQDAEMTARANALVDKDPVSEPQVTSGEDSDVPLAPCDTMFDALGFDVRDLEGKLVCTGVVVQEVGQDVLTFRCKLAGSEEEFTMNQANLSRKLGMRSNCHLSTHMIVKGFSFSLLQLRNRVRDVRASRKDAAAAALLVVSADAGSQVGSPVLT